MDSVIRRPSPARRLTDSASVQRSSNHTLPLSSPAQHLTSNHQPIRLDFLLPSNHREYIYKAVVKPSTLKSVPKCLSPSTSGCEANDYEQEASNGPNEFLHGNDSSCVSLVCMKSIDSEEWQHTPDTQFSTNPPAAIHQTPTATLNCGQVRNPDIYNRTSSTTSRGITAFWRHTWLSSVSSTPCGESSPFQTTNDSKRMGLQQLQTSEKTLEHYYPHDHHPSYFFHSENRSLWIWLSAALIFLLCCTTVLLAAVYFTMKAIKVLDVNSDDVLVSSTGNGPLKVQENLNFAPIWMIPKLPVTDFQKVTSLVLPISGSAVRLYSIVAAEKTKEVTTLYLSLGHKYFTTPDGGVLTNNKNDIIASLEFIPLLNSTTTTTTTTVDGAQLWEGNSSSLASHPDSKKFSHHARGSIKAKLKEVEPKELDTSSTSTVSSVNKPIGLLTATNIYKTELASLISSRKLDIHETRKSSRGSSDEPSSDDKEERNGMKKIIKGLWWSSSKEKREKDTSTTHDEPDRWTPGPSTAATVTTMLDPQYYNQYGMYYAPHKYYHHPHPYVIPPTSTRPYRNNLGSPPPGGYDVPYYAPGHIVSTTFRAPISVPYTAPTPPLLSNGQTNEYSQYFNMFPGSSVVPSVRYPSPVTYYYYSSSSPTIGHTTPFQHQSFLQSNAVPSVTEADHYGQYHTLAGILPRTGKRI